jgi:type II secretion system protein G
MSARVRECRSPRVRWSTVMRGCGQRPFPRSRAFTLIELLIVVAIIAILAAIAIPNFLEAQTRAKVSRVKADMRSVVTALEAYRVDNNAYPITAETPAMYPGSLFNQIGGGFFAYAGRITTPIAYMTSAPHDPWDMRAATLGFGWDFFEYWGEPTAGFDVIDFTQGSGDAAQCVLWSWGPDADADGFTLNIDTIYDPTNGTVSDGNIYRFTP